jgi:ParB/RepB/Spo0J family partition protein
MNNVSPPPVDLTRARPLKVTAPDEIVVTGKPALAPVDQFVEDPANIRTEFDAESFRLLVDDIKTHGILQPVVVRETADGRLQVRFGHRRLRAARQLNLELIPYVVQTDARQDTDFAQFSENEMREGLSPMDIARFVKRKVAEGMPKQEIAVAIGKDPTEIAHYLDLADAEGFILELYQSGKCRNARTLCELHRLWQSHGEVVERRAKAAAEVTPTIVATLRQELEGSERSRPKKRKRPKKAARRPDRDAEDARASNEVAQRTFTYEGRPVTIVSCRMTIREQGGAERELLGDHLAQIVLAAAANRST